MVFLFFLAHFSQICCKLLPGVHQAAHAEDFIFLKDSRTVCLYDLPAYILPSASLTICLVSPFTFSWCHSSPLQPFYDGHFASVWPPSSACLSICLPCKCLFLWLLISIRFNLSWELGMKNGMSEIEPYLPASSELSGYSPRSLQVTSWSPSVQTLAIHLSVHLSILELKLWDRIKVLKYS